MSSPKISLLTATSVVIANMIGTGVFTSLGFQLLGIESPFAILCLWLLGGLIAYCGALCYSELGASLPRSGGEYNFLTYIFHPLPGFLSGWVSATVGFAAPVALAGIALGKYSAGFLPGTNPDMIAVITIVLITLVHLYSMKAGSRFQNIFTISKVLLICLFILVGFMVENPVNTQFLPLVNDANPKADWRMVFSGAFAISLVWVSYSYSGWNAAAYIAGDMENPKTNIPKALLRGTLVVTALYVLLNMVFLWTTPTNMLAGQVEVGFVAASQIFGLTGGKWMALLISFFLVSSISSMIIAGPRVSVSMGEDNHALQWLAKKSAVGVPVNAILLQSGITLFLVLTATFEQVLTYVGFTLNLFTFATVLGAMVLRKKEPGLNRPYKIPYYPLPPLIFLALNGWMLVFLMTQKPFESLLGLITLALGTLFYYLGKNNSRTKKQGAS
jgi:basic amino acid/polyamine antiporter, APA family